MTIDRLIGILAVLLRIMIIDVFSLLCFFSTGYLGISWTRAALFDFFSGAMVPVAMFPGWLACMARYTPFPYMIQVPISVLLGDGTGMNIVQILGTQVAWLAVLVLFHCLLYSCARTKYWAWQFPLSYTAMFRISRAGSGMRSF